MKNTKLMKTAGSFDTIAKICEIMSRVVGIIFIIFAGLILVFGEKMYDTDTLSLELDFLKLYLSEEYRTVTGMLQVHTIIILLVGSVISFTACYAIMHLRNILLPMKNGRPFEETVPVSLRKIAWTVLVSGAVIQIAGIAERIILTKAYPIEQILTSSAIEKIEYSYTMDFSFVFIFCIIMFLSYIFTYGQELQKESDETL